LRGKIKSEKGEGMTEIEDSELTSEEEEEGAEESYLKV